MLWKTLVDVLWSGKSSQSDDGPRTHVKTKTCLLMSSTLFSFRLQMSFYCLVCIQNLLPQPRWARELHLLSTTLWDTTRTSLIFLCWLGIICSIWFTWNHKVALACTFWRGSPCSMRLCYKGTHSEVGSRGRAGYTIGRVGKCDHFSPGLSYTIGSLICLFLCLHRAPCCRIRLPSQREREREWVREREKRQQREGKKDRGRGGGSGA